MVKVTVELNGKVCSYEGDMLVAQVLTKGAGSTSARAIAMGRGNLEMISRALAKSIPDILAEIAGDPLEAMAAMTELEEMLHEKRKECFVEYADGIAGITKEAAEEMKGDKGQG